MSTRPWLAASLIASMAGPAARADDAPRPEVLLKGGLIVDGTGAPGRVADLLIRDGRIAAVGAAEPGPGARVVDASGLVVAPGFIDLHSHSDAPIVAEATRDNRNFQLQGVTTVVTGNCGGGTLDVARYFERIDRDGAGTNVIHLVPLGEVRKAVLGTADRRADAEQLRAMAEIVERQMAAGAWGVSSGLIYVPSRYADTAELVALAKVAARHGGIYASHIRDEGAGLLRSIDEALGRRRGLRRPGPHLAPEGVRQEELGADGGRLRADRGGPGRRPEGLGRPVSVYRLEHQPGRDGHPRLGPARRRGGVREDRRRPDAGPPTPLVDRA